MTNKKVIINNLKFVKNRIKKQEKKDLVKSWNSEIIMLEEAIDFLSKSKEDPLRLI